MHLGIRSLIFEVTKYVFFDELPIMSPEDLLVAEDSHSEMTVVS